MLCSKNNIRLTTGCPRLIEWDSYYFGIVRLESSSPPSIFRFRQSRIWIAAVQRPKLPPRARQGGVQKNVAQRRDAAMVERWVASACFVEWELGGYRRNGLVPVPEADDPQSLIRLSMADGSCLAAANPSMRADESRR